VAGDTFRVVLSEKEIGALTRELGLEACTDGLFDALRPAYRLEPARDGAHRIGGTPDLTTGETWPRNLSGDELTFIGQLDVAEIPALPGAGPEVEDWRSTAGFVRLFADLLDDQSHPARVTALIADAAAPRTRVATPARTAGEDGLGEFAECTVEALPCWCLEDDHPGVECAAAIDPGGIDNAPLLEFSHRLHAGRSLDRGWHVLPQLLGTPDLVQDDPRYDGAHTLGDPMLQDIEAWTLLLQFDDSFADYGDGGGFFVVIPRIDLAAGRYDRALALTQAG
jgi:Domain of unknown function (DUF1963)